MPGGMEWVILLVVVVLLFGAKRLPELARSVGRSARVFRGEIKGMASDGEQHAPAEPARRPAEEPRAALPAGQSAAQTARSAETAEAAPPPPGVVTPGSGASGNGVAGGAGPASGSSDRG